VRLGPTLEAAGGPPHYRVRLPSRSSADFQLDRRRS
jgi:hypothetical protein